MLPTTGSQPELETRDRPEGPGYSGGRTRSRPVAESVRALTWITAAVVPFYWRILGHQFSVLLGYEGANQSYSWLTFWASLVKHGIWPIWDPYTFAGHPFAGEMQTGAFYPLYLLFALIPFHDGVLSPLWYHLFYVATHVLCAFFLYLLARELSQSFFAGIVAGLCFSLGGFVVRLSGWSHLLGSAIWLPLIFLFLLRALKAEARRSAVGYSALAGLCLALSILAGGLHVVMMQGLTGVGAVVFYAAQASFSQPLGSRRPVWRRTAVIAALFVVFGLAGGAIQLLPSAEYSHRALRALGSIALPATMRIPYANLGDNLLPHGFLGLIFPVLPGVAGVGEYISPYLGVFPLLLALIGVWKQWSRLWVRFLAGLAVVAYLYSMGPFSFLHGFLYAVTPLLWMAREASRFMYLADFALAVLAGFGVDALFQAASVSSWHPVDRILRWVVIACAAALGYYALLGKGDFPAWTGFSILMVFFSFGLFRFIVAGHRNSWARFLVIGLIVFDLYAFDWSAPNVQQSRAQHTDEFDKLTDSRALAAFFHSRTGLFRVHFFVNPAPNIGDYFGVQTTGGAGVTVLKSYDYLIQRGDLLNVRYYVRPASATEPNPVYQDGLWKVYEDQQAFPRAWIVHDIAVEPSSDQLWHAVESRSVDLRRTALLTAPLGQTLDPLPAGSSDAAEVSQYEPRQLEVNVSARSRGLLVLSETYYPGWKAELNGQPAPVLQTDGGLRGIVIPAGDSRVRMRYAPASFEAGASLSFLAFPLGLALGLFGARKRHL